MKQIMSKKRLAIMIFLMISTKADIQFMNRLSYYNINSLLV